MADYTQDYLLDKKIKIFQPNDGYRASSDAVFLSSLLDGAAPGERILDVGSGTGAVSLCLAHRFPQTSIAGIEIQPRLAELSAMSAAANGFDKLKYINADIRQPLKELVNGSFHHVVTNPPYADRDMPSPNPSKAAAHNLQQFDLSAWIAFCLKMLRPHGYFYIVNRAEALDQILATLYKKAGAVVIVPLFSKTGQTAKRVLISARKDSKAPTRILPGLTVHDSSGAYTERARRILRDGQSLFSTEPALQNRQSGFRRNQSLSAAPQSPDRPTSPD